MKAVVSSAINFATGKLLTQRSNGWVMGDGYLKKRNAIAATYSCERDTAIDNLPRPEQVSDLTSAIWRYWTVSGLLMRLVCYLFASLIVSTRDAWEG